MASGRQHNSANVKVGIAVYASSYFLFTPFPQCLIPLTEGLLWGFLVTPDIDVPETTYSEYLPRRIISKLLGYFLPKLISKRIGMLVAKIFEIPTSLYSIWFEHRSFWSHFPVISTIIRMAYIEFVLHLVVSYFGWGFGVGYYIIMYGWSADITIWYATLVFIPFLWCDIIHFMMDGCMYRFGKPPNNTRYLLGEKFYHSMKKRMKGK